ncbi:MAG: hypothetical protein K1X82_04290 [Bacteroidia bacterium]|nr:hypothetical protein [Bacteroidia bacterium]
MIRRKKIGALVLITVMACIGCRKQDFIVTEDIPKNLNELQADPDFLWTTENNVALQITGLPTEETVYAGLKIALSDGAVVYASNHRMDLDTTLNLLIPSTESSLKLKYGSKTYDVAISGKQATFSFIPE